MTANNVSIEQVILNVSKKIVDKKKTRIMFFIIFLIFSIIVYIFLPEFRAASEKNDSEMTILALAMSGLFSIAGVSLLFTILPARLNFHAKPKELIAEIDNALDEYLTEMNITLYRYKNSLEALKKIKNQSPEIRKKISEVEKDICRIKVHLEKIDQKLDSIKKNTVDLALAS